MVDFAFGAFCGGADGTAAGVLFSVDASVSILGMSAVDTDAVASVSISYKFAPTSTVSSLK